MDNTGPIVIIEDDKDDQEIMSASLLQLGVKNEIIFFTDGQSAYEYLSDIKIIPFLILSDLNMPRMNGFELRDKIHADDDLRVKCVPYIFITTGGENSYIWEAYSKNAQGYFVKPSTVKVWKDVLGLIIKYWEVSKKPRSK